MNPVAAQTRNNKSSRLNIRATDEEKRLLERAADMTHVTASQFVMQSALRTADEVLGDRTRFSLPAREWDEFARLLDRPARELPALKRAAAKPSPFSER
jgi:uncharacterized protein (DUF1778 family)